MNTYKTYSEQQLLKLLASGDEMAFTEIYNRYWQMLFRTAYRILDETETAQDIIQNVFVDLWQKKEKLQIIYLKAYLQQAIKYSVFKEIRKKQYDKSFYERLAYITIDVLYENPLLLEEQQKLIQQIIDAMPENCRETFRLSREEKMTYKQIATLMSVSEKTVEKRMSQALRTLRIGLSTSFCISILTIIG